MTMALPKSFAKAGKSQARGDRFPGVAPLATAAADYDIVRRAIAHIRGHWRAQPEIDVIAEAAGVKPHQRRNR